ncbi:putative CtpA-like serine protease [Symmachiella dynata]|uniref:S41 family peptidase n=1 Tax=Symmachiella dynata TaxID=2527995 RepID=UPI0011890ACA|nr:S41 family peptidase [Symmachiella dynata]QDT50688.1 putative CtpA-like serine protease [Symmachiella dynata]
MRRALIRFSALWIPVLLIAGLNLPAQGEDAEVTNPDVASDVKTSVDEIMHVVNLVLEHHIAPPTGQEMVLDVIREMQELTDLPMPQNMPQQVSQRSMQELPRYLNNYLTKIADPSAWKLQSLARRSLIRVLLNLPGGARITAVRKHTVDEQIASNRYVGTGIALRMSSTDNRPTIAQVIAGGPMELAGGKKDDLIIEVNGISTKGKKLSEVVEMIRGPDGSDITFVVHQPDQPQRTLSFQRGVINIPSLAKPELLQLPGPKLIGYMKIKRISAALVHELRQAEKTLLEQDVDGIVLDFRMVHGADVHQSLLLANALLDGGDIGQVRLRSGSRSYQAEREALFAKLPMAIIVNRHTTGTAEWVVAALQDHKRALIVGEKTAGHGYGESTLPIPGTDQMLTMSTSELLRADGISLVGIDRPSNVTALVERTPDGRREKMVFRNGKRIQYPPGPVVPNKHIDYNSAQHKTKAAEVLTNVIKRRKAEEVLLKGFKKTKPTVD